MQQKTLYSLGDFDPKKKKEDSADSLSSGSLGAADGHNATLHFKAPIHIVLAKQHNKIRPGVKVKELPDPLPGPMQASSLSSPGPGDSSGSNNTPVLSQTLSMTPSPGAGGGAAGAGGAAGSLRGADEVEPATQRDCFERLNFAIVRAFQKTTAAASSGRPAGGATVTAAAADSSLAALLHVAAQLDALEAGLLGTELLQANGSGSAAASGSVHSGDSAVPPTLAATLGLGSPGTGQGGSILSTPTRRVDAQFLREIRRLVDAVRQIDDDSPLLVDAAFQQQLLHPNSRSTPSN